MNLAIRKPINSYKSHQADPQTARKVKRGVWYDKMNWNLFNILKIPNLVPYKKLGGSRPLAPRSTTALACVRHTCTSYNLSAYIST